jgi:H+/Cl- antiporter ClcA
LATKEPSGNPHEIAAALSEVTERAQMLVREEIELAKTEITVKLQRLARGAAVGAIAGVFVIAALVLILQGFAWLAYFVLPVGHFAYFWGFFLVAVILLVLGGIAGFLAARFFKAGAPPTPELAIQEAQRIRESVQKAT